MFLGPEPPRWGVDLAQMSQKLSAGKFGEIFQLQSEKVVVIMLVANNDFAVLNRVRNQFSEETVDLHANYPLPYVTVLPVGTRN